MGWALHPVTSVLMRDRKEDRDTGAVKPEAEIGTKLPPAKECLESPEL